MSTIRPVAPPRPPAWLRMRPAATTAPASAATVTGVPRTPDDDRDDGPGAGAERDAEDVGARERVAEQTWNAEPAAPNAAPASTAMRARGSVDSISTNDAPGICSPPMIAIASGKETR